MPLTDPGGTLDPWRSGIDLEQSGIDPEQPGSDPEDETPDPPDDPPPEPPPEQNPQGPTPMATRFIHDGDSIDYTPASAVTAGDVIVQGDLVGVAKRDIEANVLGALAVKGVFDFPKATGVDTAIDVGLTVYWDATNEQITTTATGNKLAGKTVLAATDDDTTVRVRLSQ